MVETCGDQPRLRFAGRSEPWRARTCRRSL